MRVSDPVQIIVAWTEEGVVAFRERRADLGELPELTHGIIAKTALWKNKGQPEDVAKAEVFAKQNGYRVFTFPTSVKDARTAAAKAILKEFNGPVAVKPTSRRRSR